MIFSQKWIADAVAKVFDKPASELTADDMASIKYLAFGESFQNNFFIELSIEQPPEPFVNSDGGEEWALCLRGEDISKLVVKFKGRNNEQLSMFGLEREDEEWQEFVYSRKTKKIWENFGKSVKTAHYYEKFEDDDEFDEWYDGVAESAYRDIALFTGLEVLRIQGLKIPDLTFLDKLPDLRVIELVETEFVSTEGIEKLTCLEQVACWLD